jgi:putative endonuclease
MPYLVYIIYSVCLDQYYIGHTENIQDRLFRHNNSGSKSTKKANNWRLVYTQQFDNKSAANHRELEIKRKKSRKYAEWLISQVG